MNEKDFLESLLQKGKDVKRLVSPFQALPLKEKIIQYAYTSVNITFGNIAEKVVKEILTSYGAHYHQRRVEGKDIDQFFSYKGKNYFIEQKIRDDHDSTKKVGQMENYNEKKNLVNNLGATACWFIDPSFTKNHKYYSQCINDELYYGDEINIFLVNIFGDKAKDFFTSFYNTLVEQKRTMSKITFTFSTSIDLENIYLPVLCDLFLYGDKQEIINCFFGGKDPKQDILNYCASYKETPKLKALMEMFL